MFPGMQLEYGKYRSVEDGRKLSLSLLLLLLLLLLLKSGSGGKPGGSEGKFLPISL